MGWGEGGRALVCQGQEGLRETRGRGKEDKVFAKPERAELGELSSLRIQYDFSKEEWLRGGWELGRASLRGCVCVWGGYLVGMHVFHP